MSIRTGSDVYVTRKQGHLEEVFTQTSLHNLFDIYYLYIYILFIEYTE